MFKILNPFFFYLLFATTYFCDSQIQGVHVDKCLRQGLFRYIYNTKQDGFAAINVREGAILLIRNLIIVKRKQNKQ